MCKAMKRITRVALFVLVLSVLMTTALASKQHFAYNWSITSANQRSRTFTWTAQLASSQMFIRTQADTMNVGAEDTYYKVALKSGGSASEKVKCNMGYLVQRDISGSYTKGNKYGSYAWRVDSTLNTEIVDGLTEILSYNET